MEENLEEEDTLTSTDETITNTVQTRLRILLGTTGLQTFTTYLQSLPRSATDGGDRLQRADGITIGDLDKDIKTILDKILNAYVMAYEDNEKNKILHAKAEYRVKHLIRILEEEEKKKIPPEEFISVLDSHWKDAQRVSKEK